MKNIYETPAFEVAIAEIKNDILITSENFTPGIGDDDGWSDIWA